MHRRVNLTVTVWIDDPLLIDFERAFAICQGNQEATRRLQAQIAPCIPCDYSTYAIGWNNKFHLLFLDHGCVTITDLNVCPKLWSTRSQAFFRMLSPTDA